MLHLLRARFGVALADAVGKVLLIDGRQAQAPFAVPAKMANGSELVRRLMRKSAGAEPVPGVAARAGVRFSARPRAGR